MATTTPNYGWDVPTSTDYVKDGATAIETLGDDIDASLFSITSGKNVGAVHLYSASFSSVSTVSFDNIFTASFKNYVVKFDYVHSTGSAVVYARYRAGGSDLTGATDYSYQENYFTTALTATRSTGISYVEILANVGATNAVFDYNVNSPMQALSTHSTYIGGAGALSFNGGGKYNPTTAVDGMKFIFSAGTATGNVHVYGFRSA